MNTTKMQQSITADEARAIAREAYIYGFPMVDAYRIEHAYYLDPKSPEYKAPINTLCNIPRVYTSEDIAVQTPNSDTPYSMIWMDLRAEPMVLTVPEIERERYYSIQLIDLYTHNFSYIGTRTTGNAAGNYLIAGPGWTGQAPAGVNQVIRSETEFVLGIYRTQLFNPADLDNVKKIQEGYKAQPLSSFAGTPPPQTAPAIDFISPLTPETQRTSLEFFNILNFILQFCPTHPSEKELMERFAKIGIGAGKHFAADEFETEITFAIREGISDAWSEDMASISKKIDAKEISSGELFGTREVLKNNYLYRMAGAVLGIFGNSTMEALYPVYTIDADGQPLTGEHNYELHFEPDNFPPVNAFWSLTMYELPKSLLVANPIDRYLINSPMLPNLKRDDHGGLTIYIQNASPGDVLESNWLPAPKGAFMVVLRLYSPKEEALNGKWTTPKLARKK